MTAPRIENWSHTTGDMSQIRSKGLVKGITDTVQSPAVIGATSLQLNGSTAYQTYLANTIVIGYNVYQFTAVDITNNVLAFTPGLLEAATAGDEVSILGAVVDLNISSSITALEGGDGIYEHYVADGRLNPVGVIDRINTELFHGLPQSSGYFETRNQTLNPGRRLQITGTNISSVTHYGIARRVTMNFDGHCNKAWSSSVTTRFPIRQVEYDNGRALGTDALYALMARAQDLSNR